MVATRNYYIPRNCVGRHVMNAIVEKIPCSVGDFKINRETNTIKFTVTCELGDIPKIEKILKRYDMIGE